MQHILTAFEEYIASVRSEGTASQYFRTVRKFLNWLDEKGFELEKAPKNTLQLYCAGLVKEGYKPATVHLNIAGVKRFLKWCSMDSDLPAFYPAELPKNNIKIKDILSPASMDRYVELAGELKEPARTAVMLLLYSGVRGKEMVSLPLKCLRKVPLKLKSGVKKQTLMLVVAGKGGDERLVPILDEGVPIIMSYLDGWRKKHPDSTWFFPSSRIKNKHLSVRFLRSAVEEIKEPLKINLTPHTMRRTYLTLLYRKGVDPVILAKIAGHKDIQTLIKYYLRLDEIDLAQAVHDTGGKLS